MEWFTYPNLPPIAPSQFVSSDPRLGRCPVLLSGRAIKHLGQYRGNSASFRDVLKTLNRLSKEKFTEDNHQLVAGGETFAPIYKAELLDGMYLVYQKDLISDAQGTEKMALRVYGIYTNNKIDTLIWERISRKSDAETPTLTDAQRLEIHDLLTLEKFIPYSESVVKSIWADLDSAFVFDLSPKEQEIIHHPSSCYVIGRSGTGKTTTMLFRMLMREKTPNGLDRPLRQVFVTQSNVLAGRVAEYYHKLDETLAAGSKSVEEIKRIAAENCKQEAQQDLFDLDDENELRIDLPERYSELRDEHFPLFLTFNQLCKLLAADCDAGANTRAPALGGSVPNLVSFEEFLGRYWLHTNHQFTRGLDPALVWSEIIGVIKGSETTVDTPKGYLSQNSYLALSHRAQTTFAKRPENVYGIFESYMKRKGQTGAIDAADRTHALLQGIKSKFRPHPLDFMYVDEVQDNLIIDTRLLRALCPNPHGLFWAGDTAQTISVGCTFKFSDMTASHYRLENADPLVRANKREAVYPKSFELSVNYRSHAGIVNAASSIVDLLLTLFPKSIDKLEPETGLTAGPMPVFFSGWDSTAVGFEKFLNGRGDSPIEFGAQQCIIVRSADVRDKLRDQIGRIACIMTPYEAKGLEFNDVLLYNFFSDSHASHSEWGVVLNSFERAHDQARYAIICSELKCLYVAVTRARNNCWIWDSSDNAEPMKGFWLNRHQIRIVRPGNPIPQLTVLSSAGDWKKTGRELFARQLYDEAMLCFERAGSEFETSVCKAYLRRSQARRAAMSSPAAGKSLYNRAAWLFMSCVGLAPQRRILLCFRLAADCFALAPDYEKAGDVYQDAEEFTLSAQSYRKAGNFEKCAEIIQKYRSYVDDEVAAGLSEVCKLGLIRENKFKNLKSSSLVKSQDELLELLEGYGFHAARVDILLDSGRTKEAAELRVQEGRLIEGIELFLKQDDPSSHQRAASCIISGLWKLLPLRALASIPSDARTILSLAKRLNVRHLNTLLRAEVSQDLDVFQALISKDEAQLRNLYRLHATHEPHLAILCLDDLLRTTPALQQLDVTPLIYVLDEYDRYGELLRGATVRQNLCSILKVQRLFGFEPMMDSDGAPIPDKYRVWGSALLRENSRVELLRCGRAISENADILADGGTLAHLLRSCITQRLYDRIFDLEEKLRYASALRPCLEFALRSQCSTKFCSLSHIDSNPRAFNQRVRICIQQIMILRHLASLPCGHQQAQALRGVQQFWLERLFEVLHPPWYQVGNFHALVPEAIPQFEAALDYIRFWLRDQLYQIDDDRSPLLTHMNILLTTGVMISKFDLPEASRYIWTAPCFTTQRPSFFRTENADRVSIVQDLFGCLMGSCQGRIHRGLYLVEHVLDTGIYINLNLLLSFIEKLVAHTLFETRRWRGDVSLSGLTLPNSWMMEAIQPHGYFSMLRADQGCIRHSRLALQRLLSLVFKEPARVWYDGNQRLHEVSPRLRDAAITRICCALAMIGYNVRNARGEIFEALASVASLEKEPSPLYAAFTKARGWYGRPGRPGRYGFMDAVEIFVQRCHMDGLVQLRHYKRQAWPRHNIQIISFHSFEDLRHRMVYPGGITSIPMLRTVAPATLHTVAGIIHNELLPPAAEPDERTDFNGSLSFATSNERPDAEDAGYEENDNDHAEEEAPLLDLTTTEDLAMELTEEQRVAAIQIQRAYRRCLRRRAALQEAQRKPALRYFISCMNTALGSGIDAKLSRSYMHFFRGPLPHILAFIETVRDLSLQRKDEAKRQCRVAVHTELEKVQQDLTDSNSLFKTFCALMKKLEPNSEVHQSCSIQQLKDIVAEVCNHKERVRVVLGEAAAADSSLEVGVKGILQSFVPRPTRRQPRRPALNVDDEFSWNLYD
ncbi:hypothetical protein BOTBODRAFT_185909 [Botryobasidium botryosum FD-172 SS1]|uniref:UvrD-like helicase ATP-binding domain-containing protein n=1 Tax=Botryobasidium botryosum (strain FD-172 SS1) TaxID=930990 RepID=A0A067N063_BOTB1|nr:hypothetical protein BOTBODRAFT_185909 [Botryobasidium botryosum FD-172 SS1]